MIYVYKNIPRPNLTQLHREISDILSNLQYVNWFGKKGIIEEIDGKPVEVMYENVLEVAFEGELSSEEKTTLNIIIENHQPLPEEEIGGEEMEIILHKGKDRKLKIYGVSFVAQPGISDYDFQMPFTAAIQYGTFYAGESKTGDRIWFILAPDTPMEYAYVDGAYVTKGGNYRWGEAFGTSSDIPVGTPLRVRYENTDTEPKTINFNMELRMPD